MSYEITKFVLALDGLTPSEKAVAHSLAYHAHADGSESYPSMTTIAAEAGFKRRRNAQLAVRRLEEKGVIIAETSKSGGRNKSTHYRFNLGNRVSTDALSADARKETASIEVGNCVSTGQKQRLYGRTKGPERTERSWEQSSDSTPTHQSNPNPPNSAASASSKNQNLSMKRKLSYLPEDFQPSDKARAVVGGLGLNLQECLAGFVDYYTANGERMVDWHAAFSSWARRERKWSGNKKSSAPTYTGSLSENIRLLREGHL